MNSRNLNILFIVFSLFSLGCGPQTADSSIFLSNLNPKESPVVANASTPTPVAVAEILSPTSLLALVASSAQINLSWIDNSTNESGFKIERSTSPTGPFTEIATTSADMTSYSNLGLSSATSYFYRVKSYNTTLSSNFSLVASATTLAPSALASVAIGSPSISLARSNSTISFSINYINAANIALASMDVSQVKTGTATCASTVVSGSGLTTRTVSLSACSGDGTIKINIAAGTATNNMSVAAVGAGPSSVFTVDNSGPTVPSNLVAVASSSSAIGLTWSASSDAGAGVSNYEVQLASGVAVGSAMSTTLSVAGLTANTQYCYQVRALDSLGNASAYSAQACATTRELVPAMPTNLIATAVSVAQINLGWTDASNNETGFKIERGASATGPFTEIGTTGAGATSYSSTGLSASTNYFFRIRSSGSAGDSAYSSIASATTLAPSALATLAISAPSLFQAKASSTITYTVTYSNAAAITLAAANITQVKTGTASCGSPSVSGSGLLTRTISLSSCSGDGTIKISIAAGTATNNMSVAAVAVGPSSAFTVDNTPPALPSNLIAAASSVSSLNLSWNASTDAGSGLAGYRVQLVAGTLVASPTSNFLQITGLNEGTPNCYQVQALDNLGNTSALSAQACATTSTFTQAELFAQAKIIFAANCNSCHQTGGQASFARLDYTMEAEFLTAQIPQIVAGDSVNSKVIKKSVYSGVAGANMPPAVGAYTQANHNTLVRWVNGVQPITNPPPSSPFTCSNENDVGASQIKRLSKTQYIHSLTDLFGATSVSQLSSSLALLPEDNTNDESKDLNSVTGDKVEAYMDIAIALATYITASDSRTSSTFGACSLTATPSTTDTCINTYLGSTTYSGALAQKIFRRPLTSAEITDAKSIIGLSGTYRRNLKILLARHLQAPAFLYRIEVGSVSDDLALFPITSFEVATRIAFATTDSTPSTALLTAAQNNQLTTVTQLDAQVRSLLGTARGKTKIRTMFRQWLQQLGSVNTSTLPAGLTAGIQTTGLEEAISTETDQFLDYIIWERNAGYKDLITSKASFAGHAGLATIYGHSPADLNRTAGAATAEFAGRRQGILMRVPYLASAKSRTNLVNRGVKFRRRVLCEDLPSPSADILSQRMAFEPTAAQALNLTTREYVRLETDAPACLTCHARINPTGFVFENFDPLGRFRTSEAIYDSTGTFVRNLALDSSSQVPLWEAATVQANDAYDLVTEVANSSQGPACLAKQTYRYYSQRVEAAGDSCRLNAMYTNLTKANASILDAFVSMIANPGTGLRRK